MTKPTEGSNSPPKSRYDRCPFHTSFEYPTRAPHELSCEKLWSSYSASVALSGFVGGDVVPGPMPNEVLAVLNALRVPRRTEYDLTEAAARIAASDCPDAAGFARNNVLEPPGELDMLRLFEPTMDPDPATS